MPDRPRVCLGQIGAAHGVRGEVRLHSFTSDPAAIADYGPLETEDGRVFEIETLRPAKDHFVARLSGVGDRDAAAALTNAKLYVPRERLPETEAADEFYHADLVGLAVHDPSGNDLGAVVAIHNFGAGDLIEVRPPNGGNTALVPFDTTHVPSVDVASRRLVVDLPAGMLTPAPEAADEVLAKPQRSTASGKRSG
jgi:16S rRNA processing protein RimM